MYHRTFFFSAAVIACAMASILGFRLVSDNAADARPPSAFGDAAMSFVFEPVGVAQAAGAKGPYLSPHYLTPLGLVKFDTKGSNVKGELIKSSGACPFLSGDTVFEGVVVERNLTGKLLLCRTGGAACAGQVWAFTVAVVGDKDARISGSAFAAAGSCEVPGLIAGKGVIFLPRTLPSAAPAIAQAGAKSGVVSRSSAARKPAGPAVGASKTRTGSGEKTAQAMKEPAAAPESGHNEKGDSNAEGHKLGESDLAGLDMTYNPLAARKQLNLTDERKAKELLYEAAAFLNAGRFVEARARFQKVLVLDPDNAVAYNGVGVTYRMLNNFNAALANYRKAVEADPSYPDPYYNIACVYSLMERKEAALKYLEISMKQGFVFTDAVKQDSDLQFLHGDPQYEALVNGK